jgi:hypothetical protein
MGCAIGGLAAFPKSYHVEARLLAQRNAALPLRGDAAGADAPTRAAADMVLRHENLVAMIKATDLLNHYAAHLAPVERLRAKIAGWTQHEWSEQDRLEGMVELLGKQLHVWSSEGSLTIAIDWPDAVMAYRLVDLAQQSFLEARHVQDVSSTAESVGILQSHAASLRADVDTAVETLNKILKAEGGVPVPRERGAASAAAPSSAGSAATVAAPDPALAKLRVMLDAKQRAIDELEDMRRHHVSDLQGHLQEQRAVYTENHPVIIDLQKAVASFSKESPQVTSLRSDVAALRAEIDQRTPEGARPTRATAASTAPAAAAAPAFVREPPPQLPPDVLASERLSPEERDPAMLSARGQLRDAIDKYAALRAQIQAAQIDLETAEAAFKYRYTVVTPAHLPRRPASPNALLILIAAFVGGIFAALAVAIVVDVRSGRLHERWQVELLLDRPILGEIGRPALPPGA